MGLKLYFLRHGQTDLSRENRFCGSGSEPGLTEHGKEMANVFASAYADEGFTELLCSPQLRAQQTIQPIATKLNLLVKNVPELREIGYGDWEGKTVEHVRANFHDDYIRWTADPAWHAPTRGESAVEISHRVLACLEGLRGRAADAKILCVSHKATIRIALCSLLGIDLGRFRSRIACPVASISVVELTSTGPLVRRMGDVSHLSRALQSLEGT